MKATRRSIFSSIVALLLCISMFLGTTFAWFTDTVTSTGNIIQSGNLDAEMHWSDTLLDATSLDWKNADGVPVFTYDKWEPGYTEVKYIRVSNKGNLNFKWQLTIEAEGKVTSLADVIDVYYVNPVTSAITSLDGLTPEGTVSEVLAGKTANTGSLTPGSTAILAIAFHMDELAGNEYQNMSLCEAGFALKLLVTQDVGEFDSFDDQYDAGAEWPYSSIKYSITQTIEDKIDASTGALTEDISIGSTEDEQYAEIPSDVKLADGATNLTLKIESVETPNKDVPVATGESAKSVDVHIEGISEDNTVPVTVTLKKLFDTGLNTTSVKLYHVENGTPVAMTLVDNPVNHNEFSYDPATGDVVMTVATFSEYVTVEDDLNMWEGTAKTDWYDESKDEFVLDTAEKLAGLGVLVDGGNTFAGKTVKLGADIDLYGTDAEGNRVSFNPIGFGYDYAGYNTNGAAGKTFKGTFDGGKYDGNGNLIGQYTISNLYVNGWDIGISYSNSGGGLFASVCDATIKNLTMRNADIVMECVEQGVIAGLAQGNCNFLNININNCSVANYQRATGGVVGEVSPKYNDDGTTVASLHTFEDIVIDSQTVVGSLWGDFDAPVGGVIGGYWDDSGVTKVKMKNVSVACRLDVYNDVTSTYQWYAYRRAGMLIGNTDYATTTDGRTVAATIANGENYLTCENVTVYYGDWTNYHYCEFNNHNSSWPFVRVEEGENCNAFSNPRWGVPNGVNGIKVTPQNHTKVGDTGIHQAGDDCMVELKFGQLYGGGQGVYGQTTHAGVDVINYAYTIQYINDNKLLAETFVESNKSVFVLNADPNSANAQAVAETWVATQGFGNVEFGGWENAGSTKVTEIPAGNTETIKLYPYFNSPYTARFVDQNGNVLAWCLFHAEKTDELESTRALAESKLTFDEGFSLNKWEVHITDDNGNVTTREDYSVGKFASYTTDVTVYPVYKFNGDVNLIPVDSDGDGDTDYYQVGGYGADTGAQELVEIPGVVNGVPVTTINADAFSSYDDLHSVRIPGTITVISSQSFTADNPNQWGEQRDTVTLYWEGDPAVWNAAINLYKSGDKTGMLKENWDNMMGESSCVFFLDANGKVDLSKGYWELAKVGGFLGIGSRFEWQFHDHLYGSNSGCGNEHNNSTNYSGTCDCDSCNGATRPDAEYWTVESAQ